MPQSSFLAPRALLRILPVVTAALLVAGCDNSGSQTAAFPEMQKKTLTGPPPKTPAKGMDRVGSDGVTPQ